MTMPTPPGDNVPLIEGLDSSWNEFVSAFPEEQRAVLGPKLKERVSSYESLKPWEEFSKTGVTPDHVKTSLNVFNALERNPRELYEAIGTHLGITTQQAQEVVEELEEADDSDPRIKSMQDQLNTIAQVLLTERQQNQQQQLVKEQENLLDKEIKDLKSRYGDDINEEEIIMRMIHKNMSAEQAYSEYANFVSEVQKRRPAPFVMGGSGSIPQKGIDPTKLNGQGVRSLVAQMMATAAQEDKQ